MSDFIRPHYSKAPIAEALIDVRISNPEGATVDVLTKIASALAPKFPTRHPIQHFEVGFQADNQQGSAQFINNQAPMGWRLLSKENDRVLQLQRIGFTYSHLPPYSNWSAFRDGARGCWNEFKAFLPDQRASRIAVRVINRIPVPDEPYFLHHYVNLYPNLPAKDFPSGLIASFVQVQLNIPHVFPDARAILNVNSGQRDANGPYLLLDIDLFVERNVEKDDEVWSILEKFGVEKDVIFEACITDKTREVIK